MHPMVGLLFATILLFCWVVPTDAQTAPSPSPSAACGLAVCYVLDHTTESALYSTALSNAPGFSIRLFNILATNFTAAGRFGSLYGLTTIKATSFNFAFFQRSVSPNPVLTDGTIFRRTVGLCNNELTRPPYRDKAKAVILITDKADNILANYITAGLQRFIIATMSREFNRFSLVTVSSTGTGKTLTRSDFTNNDAFPAMFTTLVNNNCPTPTPTTTTAGPTGPQLQLTLPIAQQIFSTPRVANEAALPPIAQNEDFETNTFVSKDALELFIYQDLVLTEPNSLIRTAASIVPYIVFNSTLSRFQVPEMESVRKKKKEKAVCNAKRCAARVYVEATKELRRETVTKAINKLKARKGYKDVFIIKKWAIRRTRFSESLWQVDIPFNVTYLNGQRDPDKE